MPCGFYPMQQTSFAFAFLDPVQMLAHPFAEKLAAVLQIGLPPQPAGITLPFFGIDVAYRDQNARLLDTAENRDSTPYRKPASWAKGSCMR